MLAIKKVKIRIGEMRLKFLCDGVNYSTVYVTQF